MKIFLQILFALFILGIAGGIYLQATGNQKYHVVFGVSIIFFSFIIMPLFIYHRHQLGKYKKYVFDPKSKNPFKVDKDKL